MKDSATTGQPDILRDVQRTIQISSPSRASAPYTIPALLIDAPDNLVTLSRSLSVSGRLIDLLSRDMLLMRTALGTLKFVAVQAQEEALQALETLFTTQKNTGPLIEVLIQEGHAPQKSILFIPAPDKAVQPDAKPLPQPFPTTINTPTSAWEASDSAWISLSPQAQTQTQAPMPSAPAPATPLPSSEPSILREGQSVKIELFDNKLTAAPAKQAEKPPLPVQEPPMRFHIIKILKPQEDWPRVTSSTHVRAMIVARSPDQQPLIKSDGKFFVAKTDSNLPVGTKIVGSFVPDEEPVLQPTLFPTAQPRQRHPLLETLEQLTQTLAPATSTFTQTHIPAPQARLAGTLLFLLAALKGGNLDDWLGPPVMRQLQESGQMQIRKTLIDSFESLRGVTRFDGRVGEWQAYPVPLWHEGHYELLELCVRQDSHHDNEKGKIVRTRFVVTMNLSHLGALQLDGLSQTKKLDLVLRSENPLPDDLVQELQAVTTDMLKALGLTGVLIFQKGRQNWLNWQEPAPPMGVHI